MTLFDISTLITVRQLLRDRDPRLAAPLSRLRTEADAAVVAGPFSVMDKSLTPPSGDKHDYMSVGIYWWPNPATPDGLPYVRRDGVVNQAYYATDGGALQNLTSALNTLSLAFFLTDDDRYAAHAARLLRTWFLDPATRMNPHLRYAQAVPGICDGRFAGVVDSTHRFPSYPTAIALIRQSSSWTTADEAGMKDWFTQYLHWLLTSDFGIAAATKMPNNHGTWYDVLAVALALYIGQTATAEKILRDVPARRIAVQIEPDGRQPAELKRTRSFTYSVVNLQGFFHLAHLAQPLGIDLWNHQTAGARSIRKALDWMLPYANPTTTWPYEEIGASNARPALYALLRQAYAAYADPSYRQALLDLPPDSIAADRLHLIHGPM